MAKNTKHKIKTLDTNNKKSKKLDNKHEPDVVPLAALFRFASSMEIALVTIGIVASLAKGACYPLMVIRFSEITQVLVTSGLNETVVYNVSCNFNSTLSHNFTDEAATVP